jgi:hypothetical protein
MWRVALICDGCEAEFDESVVRFLDGIPEAVEELEERAGDRRQRYRRWEYIDAPDGEQWFCPDCRRARDGETLVAAAPAPGTDVVSTIGP